MANCRADISVCTAKNRLKFPSTDNYFFMHSGLWVYWMHNADASAHKHIKCPGPSQLLGKPGLYFQGDTVVLMYFLKPRVALFS